MTVRPSGADPPGSLTQGCGHLRFERGASGRPYAVRSRLAKGKGALMARTLPLTDADVTDKSTHTTTVCFEERGGGWSIHRIDHSTEASISDMEATVEKYVRNAKSHRAISHALSAVDTHLGTRSVSFIALGSSSPGLLCDVHAGR